MPLGPAGSMLLIAGCCQPAIGAGMHARSVGTRFPHSPRRSTGTQRTCACRSRAPASVASNRMLQGETNSANLLSCSVFRYIGIPCKRQKQNAPGYGDPRAFALPREIGVTDLREGISRLLENDCQVVPFIAHEQASIAAFARCIWLVQAGEAEGHEKFLLWIIAGMAKDANNTRIDYLVQAFLLMPGKIPITSLFAAPVDKPRCDWRRRVCRSPRTGSCARCRARDSTARQYRPPTVLRRPGAAPGARGR